MKLKSKNILLISPDPWNHIFVSKHHYATHLAFRGNTVFFLNPPSKKTQVNKTEYDNVFSVHYDGFIKGLRFLPSVLQKLLIKKKFEQLQQLCKVKLDIVWSFDNSVFFDFSALPRNVCCISHIVDWNQDFEFQRASITADLCLASTSYIVARQKKFNLHSHNIGHGHKMVSDLIHTFQLKGDSNLNCGYAGNLDIKYIDWELLEKLIFYFPTVDFHFAGQWNSKANFRNIYNSPNFHYYGKLASNDLPSFYKRMNLLLLIYQYKSFPEQLANPHKMMEYLGSGKMIVSTWVEEYNKLSEDGLIKMTKNTEEFNSLFDEVKDNLEYWNSIELIHSRKGFAHQSTYEKQINRIEQFILSESSKKN